jgi:hypothetical protein
VASVCTSNISAHTSAHISVNTSAHTSAAVLAQIPSQSPRLAGAWEWAARLLNRRRGGLGALALTALLAGTAVGCAGGKPAVQYSADQLLSMWNETMKSLADKHAGCPYERDLPFNHREGACYPLKCRNSGDEASLLRKNDGYIYKCDAGCDGGCSSLARF